MAFDLGIDGATNPFRSLLEGPSLPTVCPLNPWIDRKTTKPKPKVVVDTAIHTAMSATSKTCGMARTRGWNRRRMVLCTFGATWGWKRANAQEKEDVEGTPGYVPEDSVKKPSKKTRIRYLQEMREELAEKEEMLLEKQQELLQKDQNLAVLQEELELERKIRALLTKEKEKAVEEAQLAIGLCSQTPLM